MKYGKIIYVVSFPFLIFLQTNAQVEYSESIIPVTNFSAFYVDAANYKGDIPGKTKVDIYYQIPYKSLQFVKYSSNKYRAKYSFTFTVYDEEKENVIMEKTWNGKIYVDKFDDAASSKNSKFGFKSIDLKPDKYTVEFVLYDKESKKENKIEETLVVRSFSKPLQLSDILFIASEKDSQIVLNITRTVVTSDTTLYIYFEIYSDKDLTAPIEYSITDKDDNVLFRKQSGIKIIAGTNQIKKRLLKTVTTLGKQKLIIKIIDPNGEATSGVAKEFIAKIKGFPASITDLDKAAEEMQYIASGEEIDYILEAKTFDEKLKRFKEFWKKKDPVPSTEENSVMEEYYRRVDYANKHFKHYFEGWQSDMGMVYIILGPPDNVDRHPFEYDSKPYEIWYYYDINRSFYFYDDTGFGDYRLLNRDYGDWYRYKD